MLIGALESQGLHPRLSDHMLPAHGAVLRDWGTTAWGDIRVPEAELEEALLVLQDFREAIGRMAPLDEEEAPEPPPAEPPATPETEPKPGPLLRPVPPAEAGPGRPPEAAEHRAAGPVALVPLCSVRDIAEGKMLEGALKSQGLHPVLAGSSPAVLPGKLEGLPYGEIRMPPNEILEARAVLGDFRRAVERSREGNPPADPASEE
jgi:hypothetical protein